MNPKRKHKGLILCLRTPGHLHFAFCLKVVDDDVSLGAKQADNFFSKSSFLQFIFSLFSLPWTVTKDSFIMQLSSPIFVHIIFCLSCLGHLHFLCLTEAEMITLSVEVFLLLVSKP